MRALVVDDDRDLADLIGQWLQTLDVEVDLASNGIEAIDIFKQKGADLVLSDLRMPQMDGRTLLKRIKEIDPLTPVAIMSVVDSVDTAVELLRLGADEYLVKPFRVDALSERLEGIIEKANRLADSRILRNMSEQARPVHGIIGKGAAMTQIVHRINLFARTEAPVLILGESGTGKELVARAIHSQSSRKKGAFVPVNCGSIPETLFEAQFFGHRKGAFSDAFKDTEGLISEADGGTLFLDEVGELPQSAQTALLRVLQEKEYRAIGDTQLRPANVRILAATNKPLAEQVADKSFREDLFYRLNVLSVTVPPLRERTEDIPLLAEHFLAELISDWNIERKIIGQEAMGKLVGYFWPGNVRELQNCLQRAVAECEGKVIKPQHLPDTVRRGASKVSAVKTAGQAPGNGNGNGKRDEFTIKPDLSAPFKKAKQRIVEKFERQYVLTMLDRYNGNMAAAARAAEMDRKSFWRIAKKYEEARR